jgi:hypothetical protein
MEEPTESAKFDAVVRKMMCVSHDEIKKRDAEWRMRRGVVAKKKKNAKRIGGKRDTKS